uniref:Putative ixodes 8-cys protein n=1 Tax=Ixodes ricinus TaxID=34613 RepID=A0A0K8R3K3_IXORI
MKVVCITLLFVIAAVNSSATDSVKTKDKTRSQETLPLRFPKFISKPKEFALKLLELCTERTKDLKSMRTGYGTESKTAINDKEVDFKKCTFYCKYNINGEQYNNVTLPMPEDTPCGPQNQTCAKPAECVGDIPGC